METNDHVSYELAKKLKKCGFDEPCIAQWACEPDGKPMLVGSTAFVFSNAELKGRDVTAPLLYHAQKWLREKKEIFVEVTSEALHDWDFFVMELDGDANIGVVRGSEIYPSYESALSAGISAALELIKPAHP